MLESPSKVEVVDSFATPQMLIKRSIVSQQPPAPQQHRFKGQRKQAYILLDVSEPSTFNAYNFQTWLGEVRGYECQ